MGSIMAVVPFASAIILAILTYDLYRRFQKYHGTHRHLIFWAVGLGMFGIASLCDAILELTYSELAFIGWYLFGAILNAAWIGQGTLFLLFRKRWVLLSSVLLAMASILTAALLLSTPLDPSAFQVGVPIAEQYADREYKAGDVIPARVTLQTREYRGQQVQVIPGVLPLGAPIRLATPIFNIYGTLTIVGGALYSGYLFYRKRILPNRVLGNVLIAAGSLAVAGAGVLNRFGLGGFHSFAQLIFAVLMYYGFILASKPAALQEGETVVQPPPKPLKAKKSGQRI